MKKILAISVMAALAAGIAGNVFAGSSPNASLAVDVRGKTGTIGCATISFTSCSTILQSRTTGTTPTDVYVVLYNITGVTGLEFGMTWDNSYIYPTGWVTCADVGVYDTTVPNAWSAAMGWGNCQTPPNPYPGGTGGKAVAYQRIIAPTGLASVTYHLTPSFGGVEQMIDCNLQRDNLHTLHDGFQFLPASGLDPCTLGPTATESKTWSGVKALYR